MYKLSKLAPFAIACLLSACGGSGSPPAPPPVVAPAITAQPASQAVSTGAAVTFSVSATGSSLRYQWSRDGSPVAGATSASWTVPAVKLDDSGSKWTVAVSNSAGNVTSSAATLKVTGIELFAGSTSEEGSTDGAASTARFNGASGLAFNAAGDLFVADEFNDTIRRIKPDGTVNTYGGVPGDRIAERRDGPLAQARFSRPQGVAFDRAGNLYVADSYNLAVRKVSTDAIVSTVYNLPVGDGSGGFIDGRSIPFFGPTGVAMDHSGSVHITNGAGTRKIAPDGTVTVLEGTNTLNEIGGTRFPWLRGLFTDGAGNVYRANMDATVGKTAPDGTVSVIAGSPGMPGAQDGTGSAAKFSLVMALAVDGAGNIYVADAGNNAVRKVTPEGVVTTVVGELGATGATKTGALPGTIGSPRGIAIDSSGALYVSVLGAILKIRL